MRWYDGKQCVECDRRLVCVCVGVSSARAEQRQAGAASSGSNSTADRASCESAYVDARPRADGRKWSGLDRWKML